jgi:Enoyl-CoA hydratase/isomerase
VELFHQPSRGKSRGHSDRRERGFIDRIDTEGFDFFSPRGYEKFYREGKKVLLNLIDIPVPVIATLQGTDDDDPLLTCTSCGHRYRDAGHSVPGQAALRLRHRAGRRHPFAMAGVIGSIRGRTFVLTQQIIGAKEAKMLGVISEIVARDRLLHRAREIAGRIAKLPPLTASHTRART